MAHFAEVWTGETYTETWTGLTISGETEYFSGRTIHTNEVVRVLVVSDAHQDRGQEYLANDLGLGGTWIQTSYNNNIRKNYAGVGMYYDPALDLFRGKQPYPSWTLDPDDGQWHPPIPYPEDPWKLWDEDTLSWVDPS